MKANIITKLPGPKSKKLLDYNKRVNGGYGITHPFVHSGEGSGCYFKDLDNNTYLDFASQIASNPLGYNHQDLKEVLKKYNSTPVKYGGQDFLIKEHNELIEELLSTTPKSLNAAFLINSGAEATENAIKICMRRRKEAKFCISFENAFHGRTLGALSLTNTKNVHKRNYFSIPTKRLPYTEQASEKLLSILERECSPQEIACIIMEPIQGEGGYNIPSKKMVKDISTLARRSNIPFIADEIQAGMGRTGEWWAMENFNVTPDVIAAGKALQVGATIANRKTFPNEAGAISSTWGGGHIIDLAMGIQIIRTIRKNKLLSKVKASGLHLKKQLAELEQEGKVKNSRGIGLMAAFDISSAKKKAEIVLNAAKNGLVILGCGKSSIRLIPPYIVSREEIDEAMDILRRIL